MVDGLGVGDVEESVLRDRRALAAEGMIVIILRWIATKENCSKIPTSFRADLSTSKKTRRYSTRSASASAALLQQIPNFREVDPDYVKTLLRDQVGQFLYNKTRRRPMIIPVVIEI
jgi:ribonuclease J